MVNSVVLVGRLGRDPEMKYLPSGQALATLSVGTDRHWVDSGGQEHDETNWHVVVAFGKRAEFLNDYGTKGRLLLIEGHLRTNRWEDSGGGNHVSTEVVVDNSNFLDRRPDADTAWRDDGDEEDDHDAHSGPPPRRPAAPARGAARQRPAMVEDDDLGALADLANV